MDNVFHCFYFIILLYFLNVKFLNLSFGGFFKENIHEKEKNDNDHKVVI